MFKLAVAASMTAVLLAGPAWADQHYTVVASNPKSGAEIEEQRG